jgi:hypothetical protein
VRIAPAALALLLPWAALAHHAVTEFGIARVEPRSRLSVEAQTAGFNLSPRRGNWQTVVLVGEYAMAPWLSMSGRVPFARVAYSGGGTVYGFGDIELATRVRLFATEHGGFILSLGLGVEIPVGDGDRGLGSGHFGLAPFVAASMSPLTNLVLFGIVSPVASLGEHHHHSHGGDDVVPNVSVLAPHDQTELTGRAGAGYLLGRGYVSAGMDGAQPLGEAMLGANLTGRAEAGLIVQDGLRLALGLGVPIAGARRFDWRLRLELAWML